METLKLCAMRAGAIVWALAVLALAAYLGTDFGHRELTGGDFIAGIAYTLFVVPLNLACYYPIYCLWQAE